MVFLIRTKQILPLKRVSLMEKNLDDFYEILDDLNARLEDIVNEYNDSDTLDIVISRLHQRVQEFIYDFQQEIEQTELMKMES